MPVFCPSNRRVIRAPMSIGDPDDDVHHLRNTMPEYCLYGSHESTQPQPHTQAGVCPDQRSARPASPHRVSAIITHPISLSFLLQCRHHGGPCLRPGRTSYTHRHPSSRCQSKNHSRFRSHLQGSRSSSLQGIVEDTILCVEPSLLLSTDIWYFIFPENSYLCLLASFLLSSRGHSAYSSIMKFR